MGDLKDTSREPERGVVIHEVLMRPGDLAPESLVPFPSGLEFKVAQALSRSYVIPGSHC